MKDTIKCIIIEAEEQDRKALSTLLESYPNIEIVDFFDSAEAALPYINLPLDFVILDINLPGMSGIELRKLSNKIPVSIFISSHPEHAVETFDLDALDFLIKPLKTERFQHSMHKLLDFFEMKDKSDRFDALVGENHMNIKDGCDTFQIKISDILYLEALKDYTRIITHEKKHCILDSLGSLLNKHHFDGFVRIHRSFAIPKHQIKSKNTHEVELIQKIKLPIGRAYKKNLDFFHA